MKDEWQHEVDRVLEMLEHRDQDSHANQCEPRYQYECYLCKEFITAHQNQLIAHMQMHTGRIENYSFRCLLCNKLFGTSAGLEHHLNTSCRRRNL